MEMTRFEWDDGKDRLNQEKHGVSFSLAQFAFADSNRVLAEDTRHSTQEERRYCIGKVGDGIMTVRFTYRKYLDFASRQFGADARRAGYRCISILPTLRNKADAPKLRDRLFRRTSAFF